MKRKDSEEWNVSITICIWHTHTLRTRHHISVLFFDPLDGFSMQSSSSRILFSCCCGSWIWQSPHSLTISLFLLYSGRFFPCLSGDDRPFVACTILFDLHVCLLNFHHQLWNICELDLVEKLLNLWNSIPPAQKVWRRGKVLFFSISA